jgi:hypothetical protein
MPTILQTFKQSKQNYKSAFHDYIYKYIELCVGSFMNGVDHISKTSKTYNEKTTIWIMFKTPNWYINKKKNQSLLQ